MNFTMSEFVPDVSCGRYVGSARLGLLFSRRSRLIFLAGAELSRDELQRQTWRLKPAVFLFVIT